MSRPEKIECEGCGREVLLRNAEGWFGLTAQEVVPSAVPVAEGPGVDFTMTSPTGGLISPTQQMMPRVASGDSCSAKCDAKVLKALREKLAASSA